MGSNPASLYETRHKFMQPMVIFESRSNQATASFNPSSGQCVTLINLSFYEPDTTFKCLNELCYLLTLTELDVFFRNHIRQLRKEFIFVVDNGPAEQPISPLVRMCLARLLHFLNLDIYAKLHLQNITVKGILSNVPMLKRIGCYQKHGPIHKRDTPRSQEHMGYI